MRVRDRPAEVLLLHSELCMKKLEAERPTRPAPDPVDALLVEISAIAHREAKRIVGSADAEDVAQDVVLECLIRLRRGAWAIHPSSLGALVKCMVQRQCLDRLRASGRRAEREAEHASGLADRTPAWMSADVALDEDEMANVHDRALARVPRVARRVFVLVQVEQLSYERAAVQLGLSKSAVSAHVGRAKRHLRRHLLEYGIAAPQPTRGPAARG
jgi:RNA polymerase sigma-70 factor, ECF subfamily